jgi:hypothetical protein
VPAPPDVPDVPVGDAVSIVHADVEPAAIATRLRTSQLFFVGIMRPA